MRNAPHKFLSGATAIARRLLRRPMFIVRTLILGCAVLMLAASILSDYSFEFYSRLIDVRFVFEQGGMLYWSKWHYTRLDFAALFFGCLLMWLMTYVRRLTNPPAIVLLAILVNGLQCIARSEFAPEAAFVFDVLLLIVMIHWDTKRRLPAPGICRVCGYDLRATPERCPECGTKVLVILKR